MKITDETYFKTNKKERKKYSEWLKGLYDEIREITEKEEE